MASPLERSSPVPAVQAGAPVSYSEAASVEAIPSEDEEAVAPVVPASATLTPRTTQRPRRQGCCRRLCGHLLCCGCGCKRCKCKRRGCGRRLCCARREPPEPTREEQLQHALDDMYAERVVSAGVHVHSTPGAGGTFDRAWADDEEVSRRQWTVTVSKGGCGRRVRRTAAGIWHRLTRDRLQAAALAMKATSTALLLTTMSVYALSALMIADDDTVNTAGYYIPEPWVAYGVALGFAALVCTGPLLTHHASSDRFGRILEVITNTNATILMRGDAYIDDPAIAAKVAATRILPRVHVDPVDRVRKFQLIASCVAGGVALVVMTNAHRGGGVMMGLLAALIGRNAIEQIVQSQMDVLRAGVDVVEVSALALPEGQGHDLVRRLAAMRKILNEFPLTLGSDLF